MHFSNKIAHFEVPLLQTNDYTYLDVSLILAIYLSIYLSIIK